eukprot:COSAG02_NODE_17959_length_968_cov_395.707710_1_plen_76_part_00
MSGGANKRREVLKFEGDDINEYMDGCVNGVTQNEPEGRMVRHDRQPGGIGIRIRGMGMDDEVRESSGFSYTWRRS